MLEIYPEVVKKKRYPEGEELVDKWQLARLTRQDMYASLVKS